MVTDGMKMVMWANEIRSTDDRPFLCVNCGNPVVRGAEGRTGKVWLCSAKCLREFNQEIIGREPGSDDE